jgi:glutamate 5-kinase
MRIVVKIGTQSLLSPDKTLDHDMVRRLADQVFLLRRRGIGVVLVSSGAVGAGRALWRNNIRPHKIGDPVLEKQILAAIGQTSLIESYNAALSRHGMLAAQILLTRHDFRHRRHGVNLGRMLEKLMTEPDIVPIVNENDSVAVEELVFTDNDELAGLLAPHIGADRLIILTDVDGVYDIAGAKKRVIPEIDFSKGGAAAVNTSLMTGDGRGGMASKLETARKLARAGIATHIARARDADILVRIMEGEAVGTRIPASRRPKPVKRWLAAGVPDMRGRIVANAPLAAKLREKAQALSLLPVGIVSIATPFDQDDVVEIIDETGKRIGHGVARYDSKTLADYLGAQKKPVFIHYNELHIE